MFSSFSKPLVVITTNCWSLKFIEITDDLRSVWHEGCHLFYSVEERFGEDEFVR
ncbi:hypothetical protein V1505DRAFT_315986 [Lipomyces doorenjongii]